MAQICNACRVFVIGFFETCLLCLKICKKLQIRYIISDIIIDDDVINPKVMIMKARKENNKGFTLVELIVVLVILAILAAVLVPALLGYIDDARKRHTCRSGRGSLYTDSRSGKKKQI